MIVGQQIEMDFLNSTAMTHTPEHYRNECIKWLQDIHGCIDEIIPVVTRLYEIFDIAEAFDRSKVLSACCGENHIKDWSVTDAEDICGIYDKSLDYHTCWDRASAGYHGLPKTECKQLINSDYSKQRKEH